MRAILSTVFGLLSASMGLLIALPTMSYRSVFWVVQMLLGEFTWIPGMFGVGAVGLGAASRRKSSWGIALGAFGLGISMIPFIQMRRAAQMSDTAMRRALGEDYERALPPIMRARISQRRWSLETTFGMRHFTNGRVSVDRNVVYASTPQRPLMLDIYRPHIHPARGDRYPAVIAIHGGAWRFGDKGEVFAPHHRYLASLGYVVFDIQYRLSHECKWPHMLDDVCAAVDWVQHYAAAYQIDPTRVALLGRSAGGHLALLAAYRRRTAQPDDHRRPLAGGLQELVDTFLMFPAAACRPHLSPRAIAMTWSRLLMPSCCTTSCHRRIRPRSPCGFPGRGMVSTLSCPAWEAR